jgi:hypothetical protein
MSGGIIYRGLKMVGGIKKNTSEALSREADIDPTSSSYYASPSVLDQYNMYALISLLFGLMFLLKISWTRCLPSNRKLPFVSIYVCMQISEHVCNGRRAHTSHLILGSLIRQENKRMTR